MFGCEDRLHDDFQTNMQYIEIVCICLYNKFVINITAKNVSDYTFVYQKRCYQK